MAVRIDSLKAPSGHRKAHRLELLTELQDLESRRYLPYLVLDLFGRDIAHVGYTKVVSCVQAKSERSIPADTQAYTEIGTFQLILNAFIAPLCRGEEAKLGTGLKV